MKALKRFLLLALALIMCMSLFACSDDPSTDDPNTDDPVIDNPIEDPADPSGDTPSAGDNQEKDLVIDYQVLEDGKFYIDFEGTAPEEVLFGGASAPVEELFEPFWAIKDSKIEVTIESAMMGTKQDKVLKYTAGGTDYVLYLTLNPITDNYFVVDGGEASFKLEIANIASAKFNGTDVASVTGITKDATGLTFTKELLATKLGHNVVEIETATKSYILSVCAVTKAETITAITFEDGKMSPFIAIFGNDYKVISADEIEDATLKTTYKDVYKYEIGKAGTLVNNAHLLEIDHKSGSPEALKMYVSSFYIRERVAAMKTFDSNTVSSDEFVGKAAITKFLATTTSATNSYNFKMRVSASQFDLYGGVSGYYSSVAGKDLAESGDNVIWYGKGGSAEQNCRNLLTKNMYDMMIASDGSLIEKYQIVWFDDAPSSGGYKIYLDDIASCIINYGGRMKTLPIPVPQA